MGKSEKGNMWSETSPAYRNRRLYFLWGHLKVHLWDPYGRLFGTQNFRSFANLFIKLREGAPERATLKCTRRNRWLALVTWWKNSIIESNTPFVQPINVYEN